MELSHELFRGLGTETSFTQSKCILTSLANYLYSGTWNTLIDGVQTRIRLREILARSRYVVDTYATVVGESPKIHPVHLVAGAGNRNMGLCPLRWHRSDDSYAEHLKSVGLSQTYC